VKLHKQRSSHKVCVCIWENSLTPF